MENESKKGAASCSAADYCLPMFHPALVGYGLKKGKHMNVSGGTLSP